MAEIVGSEVEYKKRDLVLGPVSDGKTTEILKETWGISTEADYWNPLKTLEAMNYLKEKIQVVLTAREPLAAYDSAKRVWGEQNVTVEGIVRSYKALWETATYALEHHLPLVPYTHELAAQLGAEEIVERMFGQLGLTYNNNVVNWPNDKGYETVTTTYEIPPERFVKGAKSKVNGGWGGFNPRPNGVKINPDQLKELSLQLFEADEIYKEFSAFARSRLIG